MRWNGGDVQVVPVAAAGGVADDGDSGTLGEHRIGHGDVLVCPVTTPAWTVGFDLVGAIFTDGGGALSHAAIVGREHGIPAVLGTATATRDLHDGQVVTVDGTTGVVSIRGNTP